METKKTSITQFIIQVMLLAALFTLVQYLISANILKQIILIKGIIKHYN
jgi:hypothetical protein